MSYIELLHKDWKLESCANRIRHFSDPYVKQTRLIDEVFEAQKDVPHKDYPLPVIVTNDPTRYTCQQGQNTPDFHVKTIIVERDWIFNLPGKIHPPYTIRAPDNPHYGKYFIPTIEGINSTFTLTGVFRCGEHAPHLTYITQHVPGTRKHPPESIARGAFAKEAKDLLTDMPSLSDNLIELVLEYARPGEDFDFQLHMLCDVLYCRACNHTKEKCSLMFHHESGQITVCTVMCPACDQEYLLPDPIKGPLMLTFCPDNCGRRTGLINGWFEEKRKSQWEFTVKCIFCRESLRSEIFINGKPFEEMMKSEEKILTVELKHVSQCSECLTYESEYPNWHKAKKAKLMSIKKRYSLSV